MSTKKKPTVEKASSGDVSAGGTHPGLGRGYTGGPNIQVGGGTMIGTCATGSENMACPPDPAYASIGSSMNALEDRLAALELAIMPALRPFDYPVDCERDTFRSPLVVRIDEAADRIATLVRRLQV
jgi:hypothetical protein